MKRQIYAILLTAASLVAIFWLMGFIGAPVEPSPYGDDGPFILALFVVMVVLMLIKEYFSRK